MQPSIWGKLKANAQFLAITLAIVRTPAKGRTAVPRPVPRCSLAAAVTVGSAVDYLARFARRVHAPGGAPPPP